MLGKVGFMMKMYHMYMWVEEMQLGAGWIDRQGSAIGISIDIILKIRRISRLQRIKYRVYVFTTGIGMYCAFSAPGKWQRQDLLDLN